MAITDGTSNQTKFFTGTSAISARAFKDNFNSGASNTNIKFSTYKRDTDKDETNPIVPDATENANIPTTNSNISASDFRNTIKEYIVTQSGSDENVDIDAQDWNNNLSKNVKAQFKVNGTISATSPTSDAARFSTEAHNLTINVSGNIYGDGGVGGSVGGNGGNGGDALFVNNVSNRSGNSAKVIVKLNSNGRIWAGGGGGAGGADGNKGSSLSCYSDSTSAKTVYNGGSTNPGRGCNNCPGVSGVTLVSNGNCGNNTGQRSRCRGRQERGQTCTNSYFRNCVYRTNFNVAGGNGGTGGTGGTGKGANNSKGNGNAGNAGNTNNCAATGNSSTGNSGVDGAAGGTWGADGGNSGNRNGGVKGRAIFRNASNANTFFVNGQSSNNVKGTVSGKV